MSRREVAVLIAIVLVIAGVFYVADMFYRTGWNDGYSYRVQEEIHAADQRAN